jgi:hypothetical protein
MLPVVHKQVKEQLTGPDALACQRRRLPRCIQGDHILTPFSYGPAMGLALLHHCGAGSLDSLVKGSAASLLIGDAGAGSSSRQGPTDSYETHMCLPDSKVAIITNVRVLMVQAEGFAQLEAEVEAGRRTFVSS